MKNKVSWLVTLLSGLILFSGSIIWANSSYNNYLVRSKDETVVGVVRGYSYGNYVVTEMHYIPYVLKLLGIALVITGLFALIFNKTVRQCCNIKTTAISLGLSSMAACGVYCFLTLFIISVFSSSKGYPYDYPTSKAGCIISLLIFIVLFVSYIIVRKDTLKIKGVVIDILLCILYFPSFFCMVGVAESILSKLVQ
jgi:hypothetical protein